MSSPCGDFSRLAAEFIRAGFIHADLGQPLCNPIPIQNQCHWPGWQCPAFPLDRDAWSWQSLVRRHHAGAAAVVLPGSHTSPGRAARFYMPPCSDPRPTHGWRPSSAPHFAVIGCGRRQARPRSDRPAAARYIGCRANQTRRGQRIDIDAVQPQGAPGTLANQRVCVEQERQQRREEMHHGL